jgi:hypothetical protein
LESYRKFLELHPKNRRRGSWASGIFCFFDQYAAPRSPTQHDSTGSRNAPVQENTMSATVTRREPGWAWGEFCDDVPESVDTDHVAAIEALWRAG